jgi:uncharacterized Rmd1/YagE family protein
MTMADTDEQALPATSTSLVRQAGTPEVVMLGTFDSDHAAIVTARLLGTRVQTRDLAEDGALRVNAANFGLTFVFRFGVAVTFGVEPGALGALDKALGVHVIEPADMREIETATVVIGHKGEDKLGSGGAIILADDRTERLLLVATVLARSVILARDEALVSDVFERTAPIVADLRENGRARLPVRQVMRYVGNVLSARHRVMGTVQASERPDLLWDHPELDRLYLRLEAEYELEDRSEALDRKFSALGEFTDVLLNIGQDKRAVRLEAAIIVLITFEILLNLFEMVLR